MYDEFRTPGGRGSGGFDLGTPGDQEEPGYMTAEDSYDGFDQFAEGQGSYERTDGFDGYDGFDQFAAGQDPYGRCCTTLRRGLV